MLLLSPLRFFPFRCLTESRDASFLGSPSLELWKGTANRGKHLLRGPGSPRLLGGGVDAGDVDEQRRCLDPRRSVEAAAMLRNLDEDGLSYAPPSPRAREAW